ncbi:MAG: metalloregulator ArsR/SmtB family transcription factor [Actinomycetota bacterium]|nr:metalloregulator ArsR/SmtB family transcription factor [Actinomycetota bacterium]
MAGDRCDLLCLDLPKAEGIRRALDPAVIAAAAARASALADPTRLTIAVALRAGDELCVCDLAWITGRAENLVGHHLRALRTAGLADSRRAGKIVFCSLTAAGHELLGAHLPSDRVTR